MNAQGISPLISAPLQAQTAHTNATTGTGSSVSSTSSTSSSSLQTMFLNLLVTELQNQDPTQPVDPTQMVGQMISLNQLDQLISMNQTLSSLAGPTASSSAPQTGTPAGGSSTPAAQAKAAALPLAFQPAYNGASPNSSTTSSPMSLYNLYGNLGAPATAVNQFLPLGGR